MSLFNVPREKQVRVIINTDAKNEADDQFAIVHALLTPKLQIKGLIGAHYGVRDSNNTMLKSYDECRKILEIMNLSDRIEIYQGAREAITKNGDYEYSDGAELIVREALSDSSVPLYVIFMGPITDLACAYLEHPEIAERLTAIWIGGGAYPRGGWEFNLSNDIEAANIIFHSPVKLWQVPMNIYGKMQVSLTELEMKVAPYGEIGAYLFRQMIELNNALASRLEWPAGESWCLGDSLAVGLLIEPMEMYSEMREVPAVDENMNYHFTGKGRKIRVYHDVNERFILEDFYSKLVKFSKSTDF